MPKKSEKPLATPPEPLKDMVAELGHIAEALRAAVVVMTRDPALVSLVGRRVLQAQAAVRKARRLLGDQRA